MSRVLVKARKLRGPTCCETYPRNIPPKAYPETRIQQRAHFCPKTQMFLATRPVRPSIAGPARGAAPQGRSAGEAIWAWAASVVEDILLCRGVRCSRHCSGDVWRCTALRATFFWTNAIPSPAWRRSTKQEASELDDKANGFGTLLPSCFARQDAQTLRPHARKIRFVACLGPGVCASHCWGKTCPTSPPASHSIAAQ